MAKDLLVGALLDVYGAFLSDKQREIMSHYFNDDLSLSEIAENENITRQAVGDIIKRGEITLKRYESECGYYRKISALQSVCESNVSDSEKVSRITEIIDEF